MMGYYKNEEVTSEVMTDGWFHTGDIGEINDGYLKITDRKKEMFKTSGGKYIAPQMIENKMKESYMIEQCMVIGEGKKFPAAIIVPSEDGMKIWCKKHDIDFSNYQEMCSHERIVKKLKKEMGKINEGLGNWEQIKEIRLITKAFSVEDGLMTPKLSLKRKPILEYYSDLVKDIYGEE